MPSPTLGGLTLAPGDYSRVCKQTVPSARAFSPHLFERLFCQAGVVRRGTRREGCVRNKQEAQKPTIAPGSGFKPPHSRLQRNENNRQPACPEREAGKGVRRRGQTACCLPSRHSLNGACFCAVKARFTAPAQRGSEGTPARTACGWFWAPFTTKRYITASVKHSEKRIGIFVT